MRRILLILLLPVLATAQYSRWNYSDTKPLNAAADAALIDFYTAAMTNHAEGDLAVHVSYTYPAATDSCFELPDLGDKIIRVFDPTPAPDGATPLARENTVVLLSRHSPTKKKVMIGPDGILPRGQTVRPLDTYLAWAARKEAQALRKAVDDSIKKNPSAGNTKAKRAKVWKAVKAKKKADKIKAAKLGKTN